MSHNCSLQPQQMKITGKIYTLIHRKWMKHLNIFHPNLANETEQSASDSILNCIPKYITEGKDMGYRQIFADCGIELS